MLLWVLREVQPRATENRIGTRSTSYFPQRLFGSPTICWPSWRFIVFIFTEGTIAYKCCVPSGIKHTLWMFAERALSIMNPPCNLTWRAASNSRMHGCKPQEPHRWFCSLIAFAIFFSFLSVEKATSRWIPS